MTKDLWHRVASPCFVSHSYRDSAVVEQLRELAPKELEFVIFARVEPDPANAVSDGLIPKIRDCKSLIYLEGGASAASFWVSFERDYAHRADLDVFAFDPASRTLSVDSSEAMELSVNALFHPRDAERAESLFDWMRTKRNFQLQLSRASGRLGGVRSDDALTLQETLVEGGVVLWLVGANSLRLVDAFRKPGFGQEDPDLTTRLADERLGPGSDGMDDVQPLNEYNEEYYYVTDPYRFVQEVHVRIDATLPAAWQPMGGDIIDVITGADDGEEFDWNRVDDLIIRLYAALSRHRRTVRASPPATRALLETHLALVVDHWEKHPDSFGRVRLGSGERPSATWTLSTEQAQRLCDRAAKLLFQRYGGPTQVSRLEYPTYPFEDDFPPHFVLAWVRDGAIIELSLEYDDPLANVYLRRVRQPE